MQYDGVIRIITKITTKDAEESLASLEWQIRKSAKYMDELRSKMDALKDQKIPTEEYKELEERVAKADKELERLINLKKEGAFVGGSLKDGFGKIDDDIAKAQKEFDSLYSQLTKIVSEGKNFTLGKDTAEYKSYERQLQYEEDAIIKAGEHYKQLQQNSDTEYWKQQEENINRVLDRMEERERREAQTPPELLKPIYERPEINSWQKGGSAEEGKRMAQELADAMARIGESAQDSAVKSNEAIASMTQELAKLKARQKELEKAGIGLGFEEYDANVQRIAEINDALSEYRKGLLDTKSSYVRLGEAVKNAFKIMARGLIDIPIEALKKGVEGIKTAFKGLGNLAKKTFSSIKNSIKRAAKEMASFAKYGLKKAASSMLGLNRNAKKTNNTLEKGFKAILKYGLGIRSFYILVNKFRTAVKEGFSNLAQFSDGTNAALSSLKSSLTQLKNSLATAFNPILTAAAPALTALINMVSRAATYVGMLVAALTGSGTFVRAKEVQEDYAASLKDSAKSAKEAEKATNGYLSGLDEVQRYDSGKGTDGSGDSEGYKAPTPGEMFETVDIPSKIGEIAEKIKEAWKNADFTEIGAFIGEKLKNGLDSIPWEGIQATAAKVGKSFATLINGFVEVKGLGKSIGKTIGKGINSGVKGINSFLDNTHWDSVGKFIGDGLNGLVNSINWEDIGHMFAQKFNAVFETIGNVATTFDWSGFGKNLADGVNKFITDFNWEENGVHFSELVKGILDSIITFLEETNWQELGEKLADFIGAVDWTGIAERIAEGIGAALGGIAALIWGFIKDAWGKVVKWWNDVAFEDGKFTIAGLLNGIWEGIKNIGKWIYDHIFKPFIDGFKKAFGIASPSKVMEEQGDFLMKGLFNGINNMIGKVVELFSKLKEKILKIWDEVKEGFKIFDTWLQNVFSKDWSKTFGGLGDVFNGFFKGLSDIWDSIKKIFGGVIDFITGVFSGDWEKAWNGIKDIFSGIWDLLVGIVKSPINAIIGILNGLISGMASAVNGIADMLNSLHIEIPDWVPVIGGGTLGFNLPKWTPAKIPYLATGAVIPPNREFLAVLGDQKSGTNIEAPLSTIEEAVENVLSRHNLGNGSGNSGGNVILHNQIQLNRRTLLDQMIEEARLRQTVSSRNPFELA